MKHQFQLPLRGEAAEGEAGFQCLVGGDGGPVVARIELTQGGGVELLLGVESGKFVALFAVEQGARGQAQAQAQQDQDSHATWTSGVPAVGPRAKTSEICGGFHGYNARRSNRRLAVCSLVRLGRI